VVIFILIFTIISFANLKVMPVIIETKSNFNEGFWTVYSDIATSVRIEKEPKVKWLKIKESFFEISANKNRKIFYYIDDSFLKKEDFTEVFFKPENKGNIVTRIGCGFYIWPKELKPKPKLKIKLKFKENYLYIETENKGNIHLRPQFFIEVYKRKEKVFSSSTRLGRPVLIDGKAIFRLKDSFRNLKDGKYRMIVRINYGVPYEFKNIVKKKKFKIQVKKGKYEVL